ncbi:unnamed protein product [Amoebophrya sp. A25]|nr:unnamed protein product [Amoebophrya sp. A25]|eukprot:GSA25T00008141001.1
MRPPAMLHSTAVLDMWNFIFSAFDAVLSFQIPLHLCIGVFCNFVQRTLCQFAEQASQPERLTPDVFPLAQKAKRVFLDLKLPDSDYGQDSDTSEEI